MSRIASQRLFAQSPLGLFTELVPACRLPSRCLRPFSQTSRRKVEGDDITNSASPPRGPQKPEAEPQRPSNDSPLLNPSPPPSIEYGSSMNRLSNVFGGIISKNMADRTKKRSHLIQNLDGYPSGMMMSKEEELLHTEPHHFHIYAHRHNTHITVTDPKRNPIISLSCGNIGFRKSARKHYDSAFQLASLVMQTMQDRGVTSQIKQLEVVLRGFGAGREAVTKALLGVEGKNLKHKIVKVSDATRLKFGGTRSPRPRRLG